MSEAETAIGVTDRSGKLVAGEIFFANPGSNHREIFHHEDAIDWVLFHWKKLKRAPSFVQRFLLPPESGIDYSEHTPRWAVIWLSLDGFLLLHARSSKSQLRLVLVVCHARNNALRERRPE